MKVQASALQTFANVFIDHIQTSVQAVLPSGQCIHVARQLDNADVTDHYQQMLVMLCIYKRL